MLCLTEGMSESVGLSSCRGKRYKHAVSNSASDLWLGAYE